MNFINDSSWQTTKKLVDADQNQLVIELREYWYMDFQKFQLENILDPHATLIYGIAICSQIWYWFMQTKMNL